MQQVQLWKGELSSSACGSRGSRELGVKSWLERAWKRSRSRIKMQINTEAIGAPSRTSDESACVALLIVFESLMLLTDDISPAYCCMLF